MIHLVYGDVHASVNSDNSRADLLSKLIWDIKPNVVVNIGDVCDLPSMSTYEKGKSMFYGRNYKADIASHLEFEDRVWTPIRRQKQKMPFRVVCKGNHDFRIDRALQIAPELAGTISPKDLQLEYFYDVVVPYDGYGTPGLVTIDGIQYGHYVPAGLTGRALSSIHQGYQLLQKRYRSTTVGHSHVLSYETQSVGRDKFIHGLSLPCFTEEQFEWAGNVTELWTRGVVIKRNVEEGNYDFEFVSLDRMKKLYGNV